MKSLTQEIVLTHFDHQRLQGLLRLFRQRSAVSPWNLDALELELNRARTVAANSISSDVVTMNSMVTLRDLATGQRLSLTLVFPDALMHGRDRVSVLSQLGLALLGCRVGGTVEHGTLQPLLVEAVEYQPEAKGNFFM
jgi:regulator of nucleoside diphosphate kinase